MQYKGGGISGWSGYHGNGKMADAKLVRLQPALCAPSSLCGFQFILKLNVEIKFYISFGSNISRYNLEMVYASFARELIIYESVHYTF